MRLGTFEFWAMNNPVRRAFQKYFEMKIFREFLNKNGIELSGACILDGGCGSGYSTGLIEKEFTPSKLIAFDYMPEQIALAKKRNLHAAFSVGDLTMIREPDASYDAVFIFGVIHHVPRWKQALKEIYRILKTDGVMLIEEPRERFIFNELEQGFIKTGFKILNTKKWLFGYFASYLCSKGIKQSDLYP
jgi:ubiquinone/menaquinone biosynthesis C-methylase UbiE